MNRVWVKTFKEIEGHNGLDYFYITDITHKGMYVGEKKRTEAYVGLYYSVSGTRNGFKYEQYFVELHDSEKKGE